MKLCFQHMLSSQTSSHLCCKLEESKVKLRRPFTTSTRKTAMAKRWILISTKMCLLINLSKGGIVQLHSVKIQVSSKASRVSYQPLSTSCWQDLTFVHFLCEGSLVQVVSFLISCGILQIYSKNSSLTSASGSYRKLAATWIYLPDFLQEYTGLFNVKVKKKRRIQPLNMKNSCSNSPVSKGVYQLRCYTVMTFWSKRHARSKRKSSKIRKPYMILKWTLSYVRQSSLIQQKRP